VDFSDFLISVMSLGEITAIVAFAKLGGENDDAL